MDLYLYYDALDLWDYCGLQRPSFAFAYTQVLVELPRSYDTILKRPS